MLMEEFVTCFLTGSDPTRTTLWAGDVIYVGNNIVGCVVLLLFLEGGCTSFNSNCKMKSRKKK